MHFEAILNAAWLLLGVLAVVRSVRVGGRRANCGRLRSKCLHGIVVAVILSAIFPYISATDDLVRIERFTPPHHNQSPGHGKQADSLLRLYEVMDAPLVCEVQRVAFTLLFIALVLIPAATGIDRVAPFTAGRSPPSFA